MNGPVAGGRRDSEGQELRVVCWNMDHWHRRAPQADCWSYLGSLAPDVALLQEAAPTEEMMQGRHPAPALPWQIDQHRRWGSGVLSRWPAQPVEQVTTRYGHEPFLLHADTYYRGAITVAEVHLPEFGPTTFVSLYALMKPYYAQTTLARMAADLIPLFDTGTGRQIIVGGDFNMHTAARDPVERRRGRAMLGLFESLGLVDLFRATASSRSVLHGCPCEDDPCTHVRTHLHDRQRGTGVESVGGHNDYLYATAELAERLIDLRVPGDNDPRVWELSDHSPLVATFSLG